MSSRGGLVLRAGPVLCSGPVVSLCPREVSRMQSFIARSRWCLLPSFVTLGWPFGILA